MKQGVECVDWRREVCAGVFVCFYRAVPFLDLYSIIFLLRCFLRTFFSFLPFYILNLYLLQCEIRSTKCKCNIFEGNALRAAQDTSVHFQLLVVAHGK